MSRRTLGLAALAALVGISIAADPTRASRTFSLDYKAVVSDVPVGTKEVQLWVPVPHDDLYQRISDLRIESAYPYTMATDPAGNLILHVTVANPSEGAMALTMHLNAVRLEHRQQRLYEGPRLDQDESPTELARYLGPDRLVPLDEKIRTMAREVVVSANAKTDLEMARAIYDHVVATVKYDKSGKGWGRGDIYYACEARRGNCTDFHAIFIGFSRSLGIPARFAIGLPIPATRGEGKIAGYHCWAEFYAKGIGWVPIDASEAAKNPAKREYFFGTHDENRLEFTRGRDLILAPHQAGEPLNYFIHPYAEVDGKPITATEEVTYKDKQIVRDARIDGGTSL
jgi:transglutaminase-like putative cysteine protease